MMAVRHTQSNPSPLWGGVASEASRGGVAAIEWNEAMPHSGIKSRTRRQAQSLRRRPTDAERKLWHVLRSLKPLGIQIRRQAPIGKFVVDFACYEKKLVGEIDGSQHAEERRAYDDQRTAWLRSQNYRVLRFWNNDVLKTPRAVAEAILAELQNREVSSSRQDPTPIPSPQGGGESPVATPSDNRELTAFGERR